MIRLLCLFLLFTGCSKSDSPSQPAAYKVVKGENGKTYHTGLLIKKAPYGKDLGVTHVRYKADDCADLPTEFDLRKLGTVSTIKDQGNCGSCWAFSKSGTLESALLAGSSPGLDLAEQELVSCDRNNYGCGGGNISTDGSEYQQVHGQALETDFPYRAQDISCKQGLKPAAKATGFVAIGASGRSPTEQELKCALFKSHTVPWITADASNWGSPPRSELTPFTSCRGGETNHAIGVVGWHTINGKTYFIMKNSWGTGWGDKGYMSLPLGCSLFGEEVVMAVVEPKPVPPTPPGPTPTPTPTPPGPCVLPTVKLPAIVVAEKGIEVMLGVKPVVGITYSWTFQGTVIGSEAMVYVMPTEDAVYKLTAKNACGSAESSVKIVFPNALKGKL